MTFRIFEEGSKINFVDSNNILVGFDYQTSCCEDYGYFFADTLDAEEGDEVLEGEGWVFESSFMHTTAKDVETEIAVFKLVNGDQTKYLHLYNTHNGYYSHGFDMTGEGVTLHEGWL